MSVAARFLFVGEKPSEKAVAIRARWETGQLASRTLHHALAAIGVEQAERVFINLFGDRPEAQISETATVRRRAARIREKQREGFLVVGMGRNVQRMLERHGIEHLRLTHPAARGRIRRKELYIAHARQVLVERQTSHHFKPQRA
jgi:hypothetical protein